VCRDAASTSSRCADLRARPRNDLCRDRSPGTRDARGVAAHGAQTPAARRAARSRQGTSRRRARSRRLVSLAQRRTTRGPPVRSRVGGAPRTRPGALRTTPPRSSSRPPTPAFPPPAATCSARAALRRAVRPTSRRRSSPVPPERRSPRGRGGRGRRPPNARRRRRRPRTLGLFFFSAAGRRSRAPSGAHAEDRSPASPAPATRRDVLASGSRNRRAGRAARAGATPRDRAGPSGQDAAESSTRCRCSRPALTSAASRAGVYPPAESSRPHRRDRLGRPITAPAAQERSDYPRPRGVETRRYRRLRRACRTSPAGLPECSELTSNLRTSIHATTGGGNHTTPRPDGAGRSCRPTGTTSVRWPRRRAPAAPSDYPDRPTTWTATNLYATARASRSRRSGLRDAAHDPHHEDCGGSRRAAANPWRVSRVVRRPAARR